MLPTSGKSEKAAADDDLEPLPGLFLDVCGTRLALGEMKVEFPGVVRALSSSSSSRSSSSSPQPPPPPPPLILHVPASVEEVMDAYIKCEKVDADPYWCRPWPSGLALGSLLLREPALVRGKRVLDLGCGAGVAGIAAALAGAAEVVLADRDAAAAECALLSAGASLAGRSDDARDAVAVVSSRVLDWEEAAASASSSSPPPPSNSSSRFDVVLASDVLYDACAASPLSSALRALVVDHSPSPGGGGGLVLLADPSKRAPKHRAAFADEVSRETKGKPPPLVLESWEAVDEASGERVAGGASASRAVLLLRLRSAASSSTLSVRWP